MIRKISLPVLVFFCAAAAAQAQPVLSIPLNMSFVETTKPALLWEKMDDANIYAVSVFSDRAGSRRIAKFTVRGNSCLITEGTLEQGNKYWWNVAPVRGGILDEPSEMWSFTVLQEKAQKQESLEDYQPQLFKTAPGGKTDSRNALSEDAPAADASKIFPKEPARFEIGAGLARSIPQEAAGNAYESATGLHAHFDYIVSKRAAIGAETAFFTHAAKYDLPHGLGEGPSADTAYYGLRLKFGTPTDFGSNKGRLYGVLGLASYSVAALEPDAAGIIADTAKIGLSFGGGCDLEIAPQWTAGLEVRYHLVSDFSTVSPILKASYSF